MNSHNVSSISRWALLCIFLSMGFALSAAGTDAQSNALMADTTVVDSAELDSSLIRSNVTHTTVSNVTAARAEPADTLGLTQEDLSDKLPVRIPFVFSSHDTISYDQFLIRHSFSLDHFLETVPGFVLWRMGPIGADVLFSRYGIGAGRGTVYMSGVPINDPQNDVAPLMLFPTTAIQNVVFGNSSSGTLLGRAGLEGSVTIVERPPLPNRPYTAFELSKGRYDLRQRRVRFASARSTLGIDLGYDELLNDGYPYDAVTGAVDFGRSRSRFQTMNLWGELPNGERFIFSFQWFRRTFQGYLLDFTKEQRRSGHYAMASATLNSWRFTIFERGYDVSLADSHTVNHTSAAYVTGRPMTSERIDMEVGFGFEDIHSEQVVGGAIAKPKLRRGSVGSNVTFHGWGDIRARIDVALGHHHRGKTGWGGRTILFMPLAHSHEVSVNVGRSFRLPNLGERFLPLHASSATGIQRIGGNKYLDPESSWEAGIRMRSKIGFLDSETRLTGIRVQDEIVFLPRDIDGEAWLVPDNGESRGISFLEERCSIQGSLYGALVRLSAGAVYAIGEKEGFFSAVPEMRVDATFSIGRNLFKASSSLQLIAEYQYNEFRKVLPGVEMPTHSILNLKLDARLLDAHLYLLWLNVLDENYRVAGGPFIMTPRTLVYGVQWTIFD